MLESRQECGENVARIIEERSSIIPEYHAQQVQLCVDLEELWLHPAEQKANYREEVVPIYFVVFLRAEYFVILVDIVADLRLDNLQLLHAHAGALDCVEVRQPHQ